MTKLEDRHYQPDKNKLFVRKSDGLRMGIDMWVGLEDSINNYEEADMTPEEIEIFANMPVPEELPEEMKEK